MDLMNSYTFLTAKNSFLASLKLSMILLNILLIKNDEPNLNLGKNLNFKNLICIIKSIFLIFINLFALFFIVLFNSKI